MPPVEHNRKLDYHALNAMLTLRSRWEHPVREGREAAREYFLQREPQHRLLPLAAREMDLVENKYYEADVLEQYDFSFIESLSEQAYIRSSASRPSWAPSSTTPRTLKTFDGERYLGASRTAW